MLSIQKVILLVDEQRLCEFKSHLKSLRAELPLRLVSQIASDGLQQKESDDLCKAVYGTMDEKSKKKFFQLAHYTFRLTSFLSRNHPSYLNHNISRIEYLINKGALKEANELAEILLDISEKVEDFQTAIAVLKFFAQQDSILENRTSSIRHHERISEFLKCEHIINQIYLYMRKNLNFKGRSVLTPEEMQGHLSFYEKYRTHEALSVQLLARFAWCQTLNYLNDQHFFSEEVENEIDSLTDDLEKNSFVIFSFSDDIQLNVDYLKLKLLISRFNRDQLQEHTARLIETREPLRFWKNYVNTPEIIFLSIQASYYLTHYSQGYKKDYNESLPEDIREQILSYRKRCEELIARPIWNEGMHVRFINLNNIYCAFLLFGSREEIAEAVDRLEHLLVNYQQIAFQKLYDALFATLMTGYFSLGDHAGIQECYKRYEKLTSGASKNLENDYTIKAIYYVSQWHNTQRKQYADKLNGVLAKALESQKLPYVVQMIEDMMDYFEVGVTPVMTSSAKRQVMIPAPPYPHKK